MKPLIDFDIVLYSGGFAGETRLYSVGGELFQYIKDARNYCSYMELPVEEIKKKVIHPPLEHCLGNVKTLINSILEATQATEYVGYLSGKENYRDEIATLKPYKGNRDPTLKPFWYEEIKEYLIKHQGAVVTEGNEADDAMAIAQYARYDPVKKGYCDTIICTIDKDLDGCPGWHYNWRKRTKYWITEDEALTNFYRQLLTGDTVDNIPGCPGIGKIKAQKIIDSCGTNVELFCRIGMEYAIKYEDPEAMMLEQGSLLWIQREPEQMWSIE